MFLLYCLMSFERDILKEDILVFNQINEVLPVSGANKFNIFKNIYLLIILDDKL